MSSQFFSLRDAGAFSRQLCAVCDLFRLEDTTRFIQHGETSVYHHSVAVAYVSCLIAEKLRLRISREELIRGALLHDFFLYDWHHPGHRFHGFTHPRTALENARKVAPLSPREEMIILRHMFPLTPVPPVSREGWLVCLADKLCSLLEVFSLPLHRIAPIPSAHRRCLT